MTGRATVQTQTAAKPTFTPIADGVLQRACACGQHTGSGGECESCKQKREGTLQRAAISPSPVHDVPPIVHEVLRSPGQPLDTATRSFMKPRFGHDFSGVRVHTDAKAVESAQVVNALAYTVGRDVVFGTGWYAPHMHASRRLMAHELTHVVQQSRGVGLQPKRAMSQPGDASEREADAAADAVMSGSAVPRPGASPLVSLQRKCGDALGTPEPDCTPNNVPLIGMQFLFVVNCDDLKSGEALSLNKFAKGLKPGAELRVHGFASIDGPAAFNLELSCHRANKIADMLRAARPGCTVSGVFKHGGHAGPEAPDFWRSAIIEEVKPDPKPKYVCGPDATDWFVSQVARAKTNAKVLDIKADLDDARSEARLAGMSSESIFEGAVLKKLLDAEAKAGSPKQTADASAQIAAATPGLTDFATAESRAVKGAADLLSGQPSIDAILIDVLRRLRRAALNWKALVGPGMPYDFKVDTSTMKGPKSANCPVECSGTITLCPGATGSNCFQTDLPGNLFYATIGNFVGFTENVLQLGSQFAQLTTTKSWDPPEDTNMIRFGFGLSNPLTHSDLCTDLRLAKVSFTARVCADCTELTTAVIKDPT